MSYGYIPSNQTDGFAEEVLNKAKKISERKDVSLGTVLEAYRIGAMAQSNDMLYMISQQLNNLHNAIGCITQKPEE